MSESTHSIYKTEFMRGKFSYDQTQHEKDLERFIRYFNFERFLCRNYGLTVLEVLDGQIPNRQRFRNEIREAGKIRIENNRTFNQCPVICI